jgi:hypothetical protein
MFYSSPTTSYKWTIRDQFACPFCKDLAGQVRSFQQWSLIPAVHDGCRCSLEPVEEVQNGFSFFSGLFGLIFFNLDGSFSSIAKNPQPVILGGQINWPT